MSARRVIRSFSLWPDVAALVDAVPKSERSRRVNELLRRELSRQSAPAADGIEELVRRVVAEQVGRPPLGFPRQASSGGPGQMGLGALVERPTGGGEVRTVSADDESRAASALEAMIARRDTSPGGTKAT